MITILILKVYLHPKASISCIVSSYAKASKTYDTECADLMFRECFLVKNIDEYTFYPRRLNLLVLSICLIYFKNNAGQDLLPLKRGPFYAGPNNAKRPKLTPIRAGVIRANKVFISKGSLQFWDSFFWKRQSKCCISLLFLAAFRITLSPFSQTRSERHIFQVPPNQF